MSNPPHGSSHIWAKFKQNGTKTIKGGNGVVSRYQSMTGNPDNLTPLDKRMREAMQKIKDVVDDNGNFKKPLFVSSLHYSYNNSNSKEECHGCALVLWCQFRKPSKGDYAGQVCLEGRYLQPFGDPDIKEEVVVILCDNTTTFFSQKVK